MDEVDPQMKALNRPICDGQGSCCCLEEMDDDKDNIIMMKIWRTKDQMGEANCAPIELLCEWTEWTNKKYVIFGEERYISAAPSCLNQRFFLADWRWDNNYWPNIGFVLVLKYVIKLHVYIHPGRWVTSSAAVEIKTAKRVKNFYSNSTSLLNLLTVRFVDSSLLFCKDYLCSIYDPYSICPILNFLRLWPCSSWMNLKTRYHRPGRSTSVRGFTCTRQRRWQITVAGWWRTLFNYEQKNNLNFPRIMARRASTKTFACELDGI